jgi:hypothetical protein
MSPVLALAYSLRGASQPRDPAARRQPVWHLWHGGAGAPANAAAPTTRSGPRVEPGTQEDRFTRET